MVGMVDVSPAQGQRFSGSQKICYSASVIMTDGARDKMGRGSFLNQARLDGLAHVQALQPNCSTSSLSFLEG